jgi:MSHA biogenesis protein MshL
MLGRNGVRSVTLTIWLCAGCLAPSLAAPLYAQPPARPGQLAPLPLTQLDDRAVAADLDNRAFTQTFSQPVAVAELLLMLVRGTSLSVIPDADVSGTFIGELKNVTVRQALGLILPQLGLDYAVDGSFIRVFRRAPETRLYDVNFIATSRAATTDVGGVTPGGSSARVTGTTSADVFADLMKGVHSLLSDRGTFSVDRKAGLAQVTDFPERLERIATYLDAVHERVHRQVQIDARILEIELNDPAAQAIDWSALGQPASGDAILTAPPPAPIRLRISDVSRFLTALAMQGKVSTIASTRLFALNNEPAIVRATSQTPASNSDAAQERGVTLGVTPQIGSDGVVMLSLSPLVSLQDGANGRTPVTSIRETDMLARVLDGETIVIAGLSRERESRERKNAGVGGGWFGRSTVVTRRRIELVILLTPTILAPVGVH